MSVELYRGSPGKFDSRTLSRKTLNRWTGRNNKDRCSSANSGTNSSNIHNNTVIFHTKNSQTKNL